ncbi:MAG: phosphate ABC transporter substrate-binding protein [Halomonadaceae bacterium]|nr:MAG: phosphate ABC transporter substrate-binding protein [Halomonadaceae bacterium]
MKLFRILALAALVISPLAAADIVIIAHPSGVSGLSENEVRNIYLNRNRSATPIEMVQGTDERAAFHSSVTGRTEAQLRSFWAQQMFTGEGEPPEEVSSASAMKSAVANDPSAIGYLMADDVDDSVTVILTP